MDFLLSKSVCNHTHGKRNQTPTVWLSNFVITCITDQIGLHSVLLPLLIKRCFPGRHRTLSHYLGTNKSLQRSSMIHFKIFSVKLSFFIRNCVVNCEQHKGGTVHQQRPHIYSMGKRRKDWEVEEHLNTPGKTKMRHKFMC